MKNDVVPIDLCEDDMTKKLSIDRRLSAAGCGAPHVGVTSRPEGARLAGRPAWPRARFALDAVLNGAAVVAFAVAAATAFVSGFTDPAAADAAADASPRALACAAAGSPASAL